MPTIIEPTTPRLLLRQWKDDDLAPFAKLTSDPKVMEHFPSLLSRDESDALATKIRGRINEQGWGFWAVEIPGVTPFAGFVGLNRPDQRIPITPCVEIGWRMACDYWGKGYATEAANAALKTGFESLKLDEIVSFTATCNTRSQRVMQRLGMQLDPVTFDHPLVPIESHLREHVVYRISREQWRATT